MLKIKKKLKEGYLQKACGETRWLYHETRDCRNKVVLYIFTGILAVGCSLAASLSVKAVVDGIVSMNIKNIILFAAAYGFVGLANVCIRVCSMRLAEGVRLKENKKLRMKMFRKVIKADWQSLLEYHSGDLLARINDDANTVSAGIIGWVPNLVVQGIQLVVSVLVILYFDPWMLMILVVCTPIIAVGSRTFTGKMYQSRIEVRKVDSELMSFHKDVFQNVQTIKAFGRLSVFQKRMEEIQERYVNAGLEFNRYSIFSWAFMYIGGQLSVLLCLGWAIYRVYTGYSTLGTLTLYLTIAGYISQSFNELIKLLPNAVSTVNSSARIRTLFELEEESDEVSEETEQLLAKGEARGVSVRVEDVSFSYDGRKEIFRHASLKADPGEIIALVGPSGEGKTTMLRLLLGLIHPCEGKCFLFPENLTESKIDINSAVRKLIAYVPQGNTIFAGTIADNLRMLNSSATEQELIVALEKACAYDFVKRLPGGINFTIREGGNGFSEGQNQRLAVARAFLSQAPLLFLDEATSALDVGTERKILKSLMQEGGRRTCILTTHRPSVLGICNRVYQISHGNAIQMDARGIESMMKDF